MKITTVKTAACLSLLGLFLPLSAAQAQIYVHVGPPAPRYEHHGPPPRPGYAWVPGYHRWDGRRYVWVGGRWAMPPRPGVYWVPGHWQNSPHGYFWVDGHWR